jgi:hypothetical protein
MHKLLITDGVNSYKAEAEKEGTVLYSIQLQTDPAFDLKCAQNGHKQGQHEKRRDEFSPIVSGRQE